MPDTYDPLEVLGPGPFRFVPRQAEVTGQAFSPVFKALTGLLVGAAGVWLVVLWRQGKFGDPAQMESVRTAGWFLLGWLLMAWTAGHVFKSRTRLDAKALFQSWIWDKQLALDDLAYGKLIRVRGLEWLMAPRLYVRTLAGKFSVFYAADPALLAEFERLVQELKAFRER